MTKTRRDGGMCLTACFCRQRIHQPPGCVCVLDTAAWTAAYQNLISQNTLLNAAVPWKRKGPEHTGFALELETIACPTKYTQAGSFDCKPQRRMTLKGT